MTSTTPTSTLLFLDLPPKTFLGIDLLSFNTSPNFHGIKEVPAGIHFIYSGTDASLSIRHGLWLNLTTALYVFQWNHQEEAFSLVPPENEIAQNAASILHSSSLVDYSALLDASQSHSESKSQSQTPADWPLLTSHISLKSLTRIFPTTSPIFPISSISSAPADSSHEHIPGLSSSEVTSAFESLNETPLNFLPINLKQTWPVSAVGRDRTDAARDRSWYLSHLMEGLVPAPHGRAKAAGEIVGELQLCFVIVLTLANYSCLEQWKRILGLVLTCGEAVGEVEGFFVEILQLLRLQLRHCEDVDGGLFEFEVGGGDWLRALLRGFKVVIEEVGSRTLAEEMSEIEGLMREVYGWEVESAMLRRGMVELNDGERAELTMEGADEEDEMGEYAPVYVDT